MDLGGSDIDCFRNGESNECREMCNKDPNCRGYNYIHPPRWPNGGCCFKDKASPLNYVKGIDFYVKRELSEKCLKKNSVYINCGALSDLTIDGKLWLKDQYFDGGSSTNTNGL